MERESIGAAQQEVIVGVIEYTENEHVGQSASDKSKRTIHAAALVEKTGLDRKGIPFAIYAQVLAGNVIVVIDGKPELLPAGQGIVIPVNGTNYIEPVGCFKMVVSILLSGVENSLDSTCKTFEAK